MFTLYLLRHVKSDHSQGGADEERIVSAKGKRDAAKLGRLLRRLNMIPDRVLCSTAMRTRETLEVVSEAAEWKNVAIQFSRNLYLTRAETAVNLLQTLDRKDTVVLLVGHEPTMESLASGLIGGGRIRFATGTLARIDLSLSEWSSLRPGVGTLVSLLPPAQIPDD